MTTPLPATVSARRGAPEGSGEGQLEGRWPALVEAHALLSRTRASRRRLAALEPDVTLALAHLEPLTPHLPLVESLRALRQGVDAAAPRTLRMHLAKLVLRSRAPADDVALFTLATPHLTGPEPGPWGVFALRAELRAWSHEARRRIEASFLEVLTHAPPEDEWVAVAEWLAGRSPRPPHDCHVLSRALRTVTRTPTAQDWNALRTLLERSAPDQRNTALQHAAQRLLDARTRGRVLPLEASLQNLKV